MQRVPVPLWTAFVAILISIGLHEAANAQILGVRWDPANSLVYHIDDDTGSGTLIGPSGISRLNSLARNSAGDFYSVGFTGVDVLVTIDPTSGLASFAAQLTDADIRGLAFSSNDTLYGIRNGGGTTIPDHLVTIDVSTGVVTFVGNTRRTGIQGLDFSPTGILYGWDVADMGLITIDPATGAVSDVNPNDGGGADLIQTLSFSHNGTLYAAYNSLYKVNPATGALIPVGGGGYNDVRGIAFFPIPEPATMALGAFGFLTLLVFRARRN